MKEELTREYGEKVIEAINNGARASVLARKMGISHSAFYDRLDTYKRRYGLKPKQVYRRYTPMVVQMIYKMRTAGAKYQQIIDEIQQLHPECKRLELARTKQLYYRYKRKLAENSTRAEL